MMYDRCNPGDLLICNRNYYNHEGNLIKNQVYIFLDYDPYDETVALLDIKNLKRIITNTIYLEGFKQYK